jgi:hypothetical protein
VPSLMRSSAEAVTMDSLARIRPRSVPKVPNLRSLLVSQPRMAGWLTTSFAGRADLGPGKNGTLCPAADVLLDPRLLDDPTRPRPRCEPEPVTAR